MHRRFPQERDRDGKKEAEKNTPIEGAPLPGRWRSRESGGFL
jgi:hypothetical protein